MTTSRQPGFFRAIIHPQSYINILYLLLGLPLGIAYFVILVTGISLGFGLVVIWVGVPILLLVFAVSWALCQFERVMTISLLKEDIPATHPRVREEDDENLSFEERLFVGAWRRLRGHLANRLTWTGMFYLFLRFPLGIATFTIAVTLISVSLGLLFAPPTCGPVTRSSGLGSVIGVLIHSHGPGSLFRLESPLWSFPSI